MNQATRTMSLFGRLLIATLVVASLAACATMRPGWEEPTVALTSFRAVPSEGSAPTFEIGLQIINPNPDDLVLKGIVYTIRLEDRELIKGVGRDLPVVEAYSQENVTLTASVQLLGGLQLIADLLRSERQSLRYAFEARLDPGGLYPSIRVSEDGEFELGASGR